MDKMNCNVIGDLLPLYADDVVSEDTKCIVEEHLAECGECRERCVQWLHEYHVSEDRERAEQFGLRRHRQ